MRTRGEVEQHVALLLDKHKILAPPVPIDSLAVQEGLLIMESPFDNEVSGALVRTQGVAVIAVNKSQHPNRRRFTIAHELAHYLLDHKGEKDHVDWKFTVLRRDERSSEASDTHEMEANFFAASLLMPRSFIREDIAVLTRYNGEAGIGKQEIQSLARRYGVSETAMNYRLINLGLIDPIE
jgi:Zn-dependent peptidase ImmA (M78 family)